jgi:hypothetical protein
MQEYWPRLYRLSTQWTCIVNIITGMQDEPLMLAVKGQETHPDIGLSKVK